MADTLNQAGLDTSFGGPGDKPAEKHHRKRWLIPLVAFVVLLVVGGVFFLLLELRKPGPASVGDAEKEVEQASAADSGDSGSSALRPAEGVYVYQGEGSESINVPPLSQDDGSEMPAEVIHHGSDCWTFKLEYNSAHWEEDLNCVENGQLVQKKSTTFQQWDIVTERLTNTTNFTCESAVLVDPSASEGESFDQDCVGTNSDVEGETHTDGPSTFVGNETVRIDGKDVEAYHFKQHQQISGSGQEGRQEFEMWYAVDTALPLKQTRKITLVTPSPIGKITYTEEGHWEVSSLTPEHSG